MTWVRAADSAAQQTDGIETLIWSLPCPSESLCDAHPEADDGRLVQHFAQAYAGGAKDAGHEVHLIRLAELDFPLIYNKQERDSGKTPQVLERAQDSIACVDPLVIFYPLRLDSMPALLKGSLEQ